MSENVHWVLELDIREGQLAALKNLMGEMVEATHADEPGTLNYEWFFNGDKSACHIYERYTDSAAALVHLANFGSKFAERFMGLLKPTRFTLYGPASEELLQALAAMGVVHMPQVGGFTR